MSTSLPQNSASHKRSSSAAENSINGPPSKRHLDASAKLAPIQSQKIYLVIIDGTQEGMASGSDVQGAYSSLEDANNAARREANQFPEAQEVEHGTDDDGRFYWSSDEVGDGETMSITVKAMEIKPPGCEPKCQLLVTGEGSV